MAHGLCSIIHLAYQQTADDAKDRRVTFEGLDTAVTTFLPTRVVNASTVGVFGDSPSAGVYNELSEKRSSTSYTRAECDG